MRHRTADKTCIMHDDKSSEVHYWKTVSEYMQKGFSEICNMVVSRSLCEAEKVHIRFIILRPEYYE